MASTSPVKLQAYYSRRGTPQQQLKPKPSDVHKYRKPAVTSQILPVEGLQHQILHCRGTPQPTVGSQLRWPHKLAGGGPHPLDDRRHSNWFGYRELRWKRHFIPEVPDEEVAELGLQDVLQLFTRKYGNLPSAFSKLDFFQDGKLSLTEWQEGIFDLISSGTRKEFLRFKGLLHPRGSFDARTRKLFMIVDKDKDGLISLDELSNTKDLPVETPYEFTLRRTQEKFASTTADTDAAARGSPMAQRIADKKKLESEGNMSMTMHPQDRSTTTYFADQVFGEMRTFAALLISRFPNLDKAYRAFNGSTMGKVDMASFVTTAQDLGFVGNTRAIFKELDTDADGYISKKEFKALRGLEAVDYCKPEADQSKWERVAARKQRSPIRAPGKFERGLCLASSHIQRPEGTFTSTSAGFYSFPRLPTGRLDPLLHPEELPGFDAENFTKEHGPGYCQKGPDYFPEVMSNSHPLRGNKFKTGSCVNRTERFGPYIPSYEGRKDLEHSAASFATYENQKPRDQWKVDGTGAHSFASKRERVGYTLGSSDSFGLLKPQPIGAWEESRMTLRLKSNSQTSLLNKAC
eukprot:TRINITY_DN19371_c0_g1_i1.p1 TRINITY_DN19371_c0_g1~~TRINITY_DN19371_c0_g1_i1.p1  ORF type:complete len:664 (+),score=115.42 TRINITY_DN19371_c0_g1_i1:268-1992(+)